MSTGVWIALAGVVVGLILGVVILEKVAKESDGPTGKPFAYVCGLVTMLVVIAIFCLIGNVFDPGWQSQLLLDWGLGSYLDVELNCDSCGEKLSSRYEYCPYCGENIVDVPTCPECGTTCNTPYCAECGAQINKEETK